MKITNKVASLAATLIIHGSLAGGSNAAIIMGIESSPNVLEGFLGETWQRSTRTVSGRYGITQVSSSQNFNTYASLSIDVDVNNRTGNIERIVNPGQWWYRGTQDLNAMPTGVINTSTLSYRISGFGLGRAISGDGNFTLIDVDKDGRFETIIQSNFNSEQLVGIWYDNTGQDLRATSGVTDFNSVIDIANTQVPEPSSAILLGLGALGFITRRFRTN